MALLTSVLRREFAKSTSPDLQASVARCEARIVAFGNLHRVLVVGVAPGRTSVQSYIERLCKALSEALLKPLGIRCEVSADAGALPSERCERLGLVIAELVTNAAKHAFRGRTHGLIRVELISRANFLVCTISDNGIGAEMASPDAGSKILEQLVRALDGILVRRSGRGGTSIVVTCPIYPPDEI